VSRNRSRKFSIEISEALIASFAERSNPVSAQMALEIAALHPPNDKLDGAPDEG